MARKLRSLIAEGLQQGFLSEVDYRLLADNIDWHYVQEASRYKYSLGQLNRRLIIPTRDDEAARRTWEVFKEEKRRGGLGTTFFGNARTGAAPEAWQGPPPPAKTTPESASRPMLAGLKRASLSRGGVGGIGPIRTSADPFLYSPRNYRYEVCWKNHTNGLKGTSWKLPAQ
jgi:hypothetical protein